MTAFFLGIGAAYIAIGIVVAIRVGITLSIRKKPSWPTWLVYTVAVASAFFWFVPVLIYSVLGGQDRGWW